MSHAAFKGAGSNIDQSIWALLRHSVIVYGVRAPFLLSSVLTFAPLPYMNGGRKQPKRDWLSRPWFYGFRHDVNNMVPFGCERCNIVCLWLSTSFSVSFFGCQSAPFHRFSAQQHYRNSTADKNDAHNDGLMYCHRWRRLRETVVALSFVMLVTGMAADKHVGHLKQATSWRVFERNGDFFVWLMMMIAYLSQIGLLHPLRQHPMSKL